MLHIKTYIFDHFYKQYLILLTMVPRNTINNTSATTTTTITTTTTTTTTTIINTI